jgi:hypothetical protein
MGITAFLVSSLNSNALQTKRGEVTAKALAQAKEALIGRAVSNANHPGSLPCPDLTGDGTAEVATNCTSYIGRLPWKTLGIPILRDADGEVLWYALSTTLHNSSGQPINSDTVGLLSTAGNITLNNVAAIVFAPGAPLCGQSHSGNNVGQYLESVSSVAATTAIISTASNNCSGSPYNDSLLTITTDQIFQLVERRIAREVKACLDEYAASSANKYPWATPISDTTYTGTFNTPFGRISYLLPNTSKTLLPSPDLAMSPTWTSSCTTLFSSAYWTDWKELVFYQVASGFEPGAAAGCGSSCLSVIGSGNNSAGSGTYHAAVIVAGKKLGASRNFSTIADYLEPDNLVPQSDNTKPYKTYRPIDSSYQLINDLALCLDGNGNCK